MARPLIFALAAAAILLTAPAAFANGDHGADRYDGGGGGGCNCDPEGRGDVGYHGDARYGGGDYSQGGDDSESYGSSGGYSHDVVELNEAHGYQEGGVVRVGGDDRYDDRDDGRDDDRDGDRRGYRHRADRDVDDGDRDDDRGAYDHRGRYEERARYDDRDGDERGERYNYRGGWGGGDYGRHVERHVVVIDDRGGACGRTHMGRDFDYDRPLHAPVCDGEANAVTINDSSFTEGGVGAIPDGSWGGGGGGFAFASGGASASASASASVRVGVRIGVHGGFHGGGHGGHMGHSGGCGCGH